MNMILASTAVIAALVASTSAVRAETPKTSVAAAAPATVTVAFTDIATPTGAVLMSIFDSEEAFDKGGKPVRQAMLPVSGATAETVLEGLPAGRYAIKAFHDIDGNNEMAVNPFGMPTEPFAFSNDAVGDRGPATWAQSSFAVTAGTNRHSIKIR
jgi:uncharacterized protein (DUF2141 family)